MLHTLQYGTSTIAYRVRYTERTTLAIHVHPDARVTVEAPHGTDLAVIAERVHKRAPWILRQQRRFRHYVVEQPPREYVSGETHYYLGRQYRLKVLQSATRRESARMSRGRILIYVQDTHDRERVRRLLEGWYRKQAKRPAWYAAQAVKQAAWEMLGAMDELRAKPIWSAAQRAELTRAAPPCVPVRERADQLVQPLFPCLPHNQRASRG